MSLATKAGAMPTTEDTADQTTSHVVDYAVRLCEDHNRINLGCGTDQRDGWLNVDISESVGPDFAWDLSDTPWPFPADAFDVVLLDNVLEHIPVEHRHDVLSECHRILRTGGELVLRLPVPAVGTGWDLTHHPIPSWECLEHPHLAGSWRVVETTGKRVGPGRLLSERHARALTKWQVARCVDEVEIRAVALR